MLIQSRRPAMKIVLVTPAPSGTRTGNRVTALRWEGILRELGCDVTVAEAWDGDAVRRARRSARQAQPRVDRALQARKAAARSLVVALTGTDLYQDLAQSDEARESLDLADRLVVLQPAASRGASAGRAREGGRDRPVGGESRFPARRIPESSKSASSDICAK